jgi:hypothetical protein
VSIKKIGKVLSGESKPTFRWNVWIKSIFMLVSLFSYSSAIPVEETSSYETSDDVLLTFQHE